jgi:signal transduction histidine kinase
MALVNVIPAVDRVAGQPKRVPARNIDSARKQVFAHLDKVMGALDTALCIARLDSGELLFANAAFARAFGAAGPGRLIAEFERGFARAPSERFAASALLDARGKPCGSLQDDFQHAADGKWYRVRARAFQLDDGVIARLHVLEDVTEQLEAQLLQKAQYEKLMLLSSAMSAGEMTLTLAHELNQPLAVISNSLHLSLRRLRASVEPAADLIQTHERALRQAEYAAMLITRVRKFVRGHEPQRQSVRLTEVIQAALRLVELEVKKHRVELALELAEQLPPVAADAGMIEQVVLNLVKNAIEAMRETAPRARIVTVSARRARDGYAEIAVKDRGCGLSDAAKDQLLSPFFTTKSDGMGLGLKICRSIIEFHCGRLFFHNNDEGGATFAFALPAMEGEHA